MKLNIIILNLFTIKSPLIMALLNAIVCHLPEAAVVLRFRAIGVQDVQRVQQAEPIAQDRSVAVAANDCKEEYDHVNTRHPSKNGDSNYS